MKWFKKYDKGIIEAWLGIIIIFITIGMIIVFVLRGIKELEHLQENASLTLGVVTEVNRNRNASVDYYFMVDNVTYTGKKLMSSTTAKQINLRRKVLVAYDTTNLKSSAVFFDVDLSNHNKMNLKLDSIFYYKLKELDYFIHYE